MKWRQALDELARTDAAATAWLDEAMQSYGVTVGDIVEGRVEPGLFLIAELEGLLRENLHLPVQSGEELAQWDFMYRRMEESPAFRRYCREAHGNELLQMNELSQSTLDDIVERLALGPANSAADIGCGNGSLTETLSDRSGARFVGVDGSAYAVALANRRTQAKRERLSFRVGDINDTGRALAGYGPIDTVVAMEVLYAALDLEAVLRAFAELLGGSGQMLFIAGQHIEAGKGQELRLLPGETDISRALRQAGLTAQVLDLTPEKVAYLERSIGLLERMEAEFDREGSRDFWAARIRYDRKMLKRVQDGLTKRYLYHVRVGP